MAFEKNFPMPEGFDLRAFDVLDSTNLECVRSAEAGHAGNLWVVSERQTAGKGRRGRTWISESGNLFTSLLYRIDCDLATASQLSFVTALAVRDAMADILQSVDQVTCKWPNDVLVGGRKISGILLETAGQGGNAPSHVVIGIGVNIRHCPTEVLYPTTCLEQEGAVDETPARVMARLAPSMDHWLRQWKKHGFAPIRKVWKAVAQGIGQEITVRLPNEALQGRFVDLDETGALILEVAGERRHITAGDVFFN